MLTVSAKNLGPIAEGTVDLKPLTIFVGPSNTGKSYMATAIYVLMKAFQGNDLVPPRRRTPRWLMDYGTQIPWTFVFGFPGENSSVKEAVFKWARRLEEQGLDAEVIVVSDMPEEVQLELERVTREASVQFSRDLREQLSHAYREPVSRIGAPENSQLTVRRDKPLLSIDFKLENDEDAIIEFDISQTQIEPSPLALSEFNLRMNADSGIYGTDLFFEVYNAWLESVEGALIEGVPSRSFYLPAARSGIVQGHKILAAELVRQSPRRGDQQVYFPTLPGVTTEFLGNLISLDRRMRRQQRDPALEDVVSFIEDNVLHGKIDLDESGGLPYPEIVYLPAGDSTPAKKFTLDQTSSMVSELAPLVLFLKYLVRPGNLVILEEPESHLHPAAQRQLARGIVRLVNTGVKVIITTHSDTFVSQINNLVALSQASKDLVAERGFEAADLLRQEQVGAYLFRYSQELGGSMITPLEIDPDTGIDEEEFAEVFESLYDESIALQRDRA